MTSARFTGSDICNLGLPGGIELGGVLEADSTDKESWRKRVCTY